jgi:hypothetical protein
MDRITADLVGALSEPNGGKHLGADCRFLAMRRKSRINSGAMPTKERRADGAKVISTS